MLTHDRFSYTGRFYRVRDAICEPKTVQQPLPPIWMGETNNATMVNAIAQHADVFNSMPASVSGFKQKRRVLEVACREQGRDPSTIALSLETQILIAPRSSDIDAAFRTMERLRPAERSDEDILAQLKATNPALEHYGSRADFEEEFLIGTPDEIVRRVRDYVDLGVTHLMLWFMDFPSLDGLRLFAREVMPRFR
jgi:alkanesulfonate monooxygenase SsuD/methylene tetrahydromethanopterin reductase-like flavin-dependent oxidoreductase (luciferase family)